MLAKSILKANQCVHFTPLHSTSSITFASTLLYEACILLRNIDPIRILYLCLSLPVRVAMPPCKACNIKECQHIICADTNSCWSGWAGKASAASIASSLKATPAIWTIHHAIGPVRHPCANAGSVLWSLIAEHCLSTIGLCTTANRKQDCSLSCHGLVQ